MNKQFELPELSDKEVIESLTKILTTLQGAVNRACLRQGLNGAEFHPLNVINMGLFNLVCTAKLATGEMAEGLEAVKRQQPPPERERGGKE